MFRNICFLLLTLFILYNCNKKNISSKIKDVKLRKYKYVKEILRFDTGKNSFRDEWVYIGEKDTIGFQYINYKNSIIDTSKSMFYTLEHKKKLEKNHTCKLTYHFDSIQDGKLDELTLYILTEVDGKEDKLEFKIKNRNYLEFSFKNDNDTIVGILSAYHSKKTSEKEKIRLRNRYIPIDNYNKTNNPFIGLKPE